MKTHLILLTLLALTLSVFASGETAIAATPSGVYDEAGFFSPDAVAKANEAIQSARSKYNRDLRIETYASIPADRANKYSASNKDQFFAQWAADRGRAAGVNGVMAIVTRDPSYLRIEPGAKTREKAFTHADADRMRDAMVGAFKQKDYDRGLLDGVSAFSSALAANQSGGGSATAQPNTAKNTPAPYAFPNQSAPAKSNPNTSSPPPQTSSSRGIGFFGIFIIIVVIAIAFSLLRRLFSGGPRYQAGGQFGHQGYGAGPYDQGQHGYGGGGGFGRGIGGGILGGLLGSWIGNQMFNRSHHNYDSGSSSPLPPTSDSGSNANFGSGGDFGGGGGDVGGGGDFGGGGGDSGGSGGDF